MEYLSKNIKYPEAAMKKGTQGRATVQFVVEKDGSITNVKILRGIDPELIKKPFASSVPCLNGNPVHNAEKQYA